MTDLSSISNGAQHYENKRKTFLLNYESAALNQLSYAGAARYENRFSELMKNSS